MLILDFLQRSNERLLDSQFVFSGHRARACSPSRQALGLETSTVQNLGDLGHLAAADAAVGICFRK